MHYIIFAILFVTWAGLAYLLKVIFLATFCRLKGQLQCSQKHSGYNADEATSVVLTYYTLHDLCKSLGEKYTDEWIVCAPVNQSELILQSYVAMHVITYNSLLYNALVLYAGMYY